ncbi:GFA family protein [Salinisphaera sp. USBA-960]|nr:GFA family protein [Salifodinibacter halophilus]NNC27087.1 GFA family protein [Salifodinibacter halophilus]
MAHAETIDLAGSCACGGVTFQIEASEIRPVLECHCHTCRKTSGHVWAAFAVHRHDLTFTCDNTLRWFDSSTIARRGFCSNCGSSLFYEKFDHNQISVAAGVLNAPTGLICAGAICADEAGDYYAPDPRLTTVADATLRAEWALA